MVRQNEVLTI